jgi:hypothetical protein
VPTGRSRQPASTALSSQRKASSFSPRNTGRVVGHAPVLITLFGRPSIRREALFEERLCFAAPSGPKAKIRETRLDSASRTYG